MKKRVISAVLVLAIAIPLYLLGGIWWRLGVALVAIQGFRETLNLKESHRPYPAFITVLGFLGTVLLVLINNNGSAVFMGVSLLVLSLIFLCLLIPTIFDAEGKYTTKDAFYLIGTMLLIGVFFNLLISFRLEEKWLLVYLFLITIMTDTFAYFVGSLIGKHKIAPKVSPKKSLEGCIGGAIAGTAIASIYYYNVITSNINIFALIGMTLFLSTLGQLGDLFFSKIKRENGIKDFSNIMPGHGGVLDRLDSIMFVTYGYVLLITLIQLFR